MADEIMYYTPQLRKRISAIASLLSSGNGFFKDSYAIHSRQFECIGIIHIQYIKCMNLELSVCFIDNYTVTSKDNVYIQNMSSKALDRNTEQSL